jgi:hypothetical protein
MQKEVTSPKTSVRVQEVVSKVVNSTCLGKLKSSHKMHQDRTNLRQNTYERENVNKIKHGRMAIQETKTLLKKQENPVMNEQ